MEVRLGKKKEPVNINDDATMVAIKQTRERIEKHLNGVYSDEEISLIMYELLLFAISPHDINTLQNKLWDYYKKNENKLIETIP